MKIIAALMLVLPAALATCVYDGAQRTDKETWKNGGFQFMCIVLGEGKFTVDITGCVWARTGKILSLGETVTEDSKTAKCFKDGEVIRFEETFEGKGTSCSKNCGPGAGKQTGTGSGTGGGTKPATKTDYTGSKPETKTPSEPVENKCQFNGKSFSSGAEWRDGSFKYSCSTGDFGWKSEIIACFWDEDIGGSGQELKIGEETKSAKATARCYTEDEVTYLNVTPIAKVKSSKSMPSKSMPAGNKAKDSAKVESDFSVDAKPVEASGYKATPSKPETSIKTVVDVSAPATDTSGCVEINADLRSDEEEETEPANPVEKSPSSSRPMVKLGVEIEMAGNAMGIIDAVNAAAASYGGGDTSNAGQTDQESVEPAASGAKKNVEIKCTPAETPRANGDTWKTNGFQYLCTVTGNRWKVDITACIWAKQNDKLIPVDSAPVTIGKSTATCKKDQDGMVYFEEKPKTGY